MVRFVRSGLARTGPPAGYTSRKGPIDQVRRLKRSVMIGVYGAIFGFIPFYAFVLHYTPAQLIIGTVIGLGIAVTAIEGAFSQMFRFRKRSSYPGTLLVEVGLAASTAEATRLVLEIVIDVLELAGAAIALRDESGRVSIIAVRGLSAEQTSELQEVYPGEIVKVIESQEARRLSPREHAKGRGVTVAAPIVAWGRSTGALVMASSGRSKELNDAELLSGIGVAVGVSLENLRQKEDLGDTASLLSATLDSTADGILVVDLHGKIVSFNRRFVDMWQIPEEVLETRDHAAALQFLMSQLADPQEFAKKVSDIALVPGAGSFDTLNLKKGRVFERYSQPQTVAGGIVGRVWCFRDVTERKLSEETIRHLAYHDALTDLPNRALFADRLTVALAQARRTGTHVAVMFLDVDRFKLINDTLGHVIGDVLLKSIGEQLSDLIRDGDTVARVGGDEFTLLLTGVEDGESVSVTARRILETVRQPRTLADQELRVTVSIGVAMFPEDGETADALLKNADTAMYRAKQQGRDNFQTYAPSMSAEIVNRVSLESDLRRALANGGVLAGLPAADGARHLGDHRRRGADPLATPHEGVWSTRRSSSPWPKTRG